MHEDLDLTNWTQDAIEFLLELEVDSDFASQEEVEEPRRQQGRLEREWFGSSTGGRLRFDYVAEHPYDHPGHRGVARIERAVELRVEEAFSTPAFDAGTR